MDKKAEIAGEKSFHEAWKEVCRALVLIFKRQPISVKYYMELYEAVYKHCSATPILDIGGDLVAEYKKEEAAVKPTPKIPQNKCDGKLSKHVTGLRLYAVLHNFLTKYLEMRVKKFGDANGELLLAYYASEWHNYKFSAKVLGGIYGYLNRHWARRQQNEGAYHVHDVRSMALQIFRGKMFAALEARLRAGVMQEIWKERSGQTINGRLIAALVDSLVECGADKVVVCGGKGPKLAPPLHAYRHHFETPFLVQTREFYTMEVRSLIHVENPNFTEYIRRVCQRFEEEERRVTLMLHGSTLRPLLALCTKVMVKEHLQGIQSMFEPLLKEHAEEDLGRIYNLCCRVPNGLYRLRRIFYPYVWDQGHAALEERWLETFQNPTLYVETISRILQKYTKLVETAFRNDARFVDDLNLAAGQFVNLNVVVRRAPEVEHSSKAAEWIATYCDMMMRKNSKVAKDGIGEMEEQQKRVIDIFKRLYDKDVFLKFYTKHFCKRLLTDFSASDEYDTSFISKLTECCGYEYTSRLTKMIRDCQVSKDVTRDFKEKGEPKKLEFSVKVLSTGAWPAFPMMPLKLHGTLASVVDEFQRFYDAKHSGRKLQWVFSQCRGELASSAFKGRRYVFATTTAQMCTLLLFNESASYTAEAVMIGTGMGAKTTATVVGSLVKHQVLTSNVPLGAANEVPMSATVTLNREYSSKKVRVDLTKMSAVQVAKESKEVKTTVDDDRKNIVSACIIRIMKARKSISLQPLITEIADQLIARFKPSREMIKTGIEVLIEKEYMKRNDEQQDLYEYVA